ncbi:MAG: alpha/beta fold hydrolase [Actinomycetota bacterium]|nr:alpha/beta fold hydrolase [Actinomycetota bacterium]
MAERTSGSKRAPAKKTVAKEAAAKKMVAKKAAAPRARATSRTEPAVEEAAAPTASAPVSAAAPPGRRRSGRATAGIIVALVLVVLAWTTLLRLGSQERGGPAHEHLSIGDDGIPATLFLPDDFDDDYELPDPKPLGERPPVVVMAHGYSADRASMSGLARSLARAGYGVLSIDLRGHGANTNRFGGDLHDDFDAAVTWAQESSYFDADRVAVLGHSMGAGAALVFATEDERPLAVIPVAGGWTLHDAVDPANALFLVAEGDPGRIHDRQEDLAEDLEARGSNVEAHEIGGTDHITVLRSSDTVQRIVGFLDPIFGIEREGDLPGTDDPRFKTAGLYLLWTLGLLAVAGLLFGRLVPAGEADEGAAQTAGAWTGFVLVAAALLLTLPFLGVAPIDPVPLGPGLPVAVSFALASGLLWGLRALAQAGEVDVRLAGWVGDRRWLPTGRELAVGLAGGATVFVLLLPLAGVFHRLVPTPTRLVYWMLVTLLVLPFFAAFEALIRRGSPVRAEIQAVLGRVVLLLVLLAGVQASVLPSVLGLVLPVLVGQYVIVEFFAAGAYARGRSTALIAVVDAFVVGWLVVTLTPVG